MQDYPGNIQKKRSEVREGGEVLEHGRLGSHRFPGSPAAAVQRLPVLLTLGFCSSCCSPAHGPVLPTPGSAGGCPGEQSMGWWQSLVALDCRAPSLPPGHGENAAVPMSWHISAQQVT